MVYSAACMFHGYIGWEMTAGLEEGSWEDRDGRHRSSVAQIWVEPCMTLIDLLISTLLAPLDSPYYRFTTPLGTAGQKGL